MYCIIAHGFPVYSAFYSALSTSALLPAVLIVGFCHVGDFVFRSTYYIVKLRNRFIIINDIKSNIYKC